MIINRYEKYKNVIDLGSRLKTNMMITYLPRPVNGLIGAKQMKYFKKVEFLFDVIKLKLTGYNKNYIITFPKHLYEHIWLGKNDKLHRKYMKRKLVEENAYED